eukprot:gene6782-14848_t
MLAPEAQAAWSEAWGPGNLPPLPLPRAPTSPDTDAPDIEIRSPTQVQIAQCGPAPSPRRRSSGRRSAGAAEWAAAVAAAATPGGLLRAVTMFASLGVPPSERAAAAEWGRAWASRAVGGRGDADVDAELER